MMGNFIKKFLKVLKFEIKREVNETFKSLNENHMLSTNDTKICHYMSPLMIAEVFFFEQYYFTVFSFDLVFVNFFICF